MKIRLLFICFVVFVQTILSQCPVTANFNLNPAQGCSLPHLVSFTDQSINADTWLWNFGDGSSSTLKNPIHNYTSIGSFTVSLMIQDTIFGCTDQFTQTVSVNFLDNPSFSFSNSTYCNNGFDPTPTITGLPGGTFSSSTGLSINPSTGQVDLSASTPGTYSITYTTAGSCPNSSNVSLTINNTDNSGFFYNASSFCNSGTDPTPTILGLTGGTFSSTPFGISINAATGKVDLSASIPNTYTVSYTTTGNCPSSASISLTVNALDNASFSYSSSSYCSNDINPIPTITGLAGGTFSSSAGISLNTGTGEVDLSSSTPGTYFITYTTSGPCSNNSVIGLIINGAPSTPAVTFSPTTLCEGGIATLNISGNLNQASEWRIYTNSCGGNLVGATTSNTFNVSPTNTMTTYFIRGEGGCTLPGLCGPVNVTISPSDDASFSYDNSDYCQSSGPNPIPTITGLTGGSFTSSPSGLVINPSTGEIDLSPSNVGTFNITYTTNGVCPNNSVNSLTLNGPTIGFEVVAACDSYTWINGTTYTESNNSASLTLLNSLGCDSTVTLNLTINNSSSVTDTHIACDTFTWIDGNTYTTSNNTAIHTLTNNVGCDSIITLNLTINNSTSGTDFQTACNSFTWIDGNTYTTDNNTATFTLTNADGCDSIVTLDLTILTTLTSIDTQVACNSFTWTDGNTYTASNNSATQSLTSLMGCDSIVTLNLTINNSNTGVDTQIACDSFDWIDGNTYTSSNNTATFILTNAVGCDSIVTLDLTINNSSTGTDTQVACDSFDWIDGNTYSASNNTATFTLTNIAGCDSVVTLNLTINNSNSGTDTQIACGSFEWIDGNTYTTDNNTAMFTLTNTNGCDSVVTLDLTFGTQTSSSQTISICGGETFNVGSNSYNTTGIYTDIFPTSNGCDSIITTNLTVGAEIDTYVERLNDDFKVNTTSGATYQWIDCENGNTPIVGETSSTFTATVKGSYAVAITLGNCSDTSICNVLPYIVAVNSNKNGKISVYPNPVKENLTIELYNNFDNSSLTIMDITGKLVYSQTITNESKLIIPTEQFEKGIYMIRLENNNNQSETIQLIKQ